jgi:3-oxoacyl-[acyl-carrier protein] reductase
MLLFSSMASTVTLSLENKVALITGGSRGIGAATVRLFVRAGAKVAFNYLRASADAEKLVAECGAANCFAVHADLTGTATAGMLVQAAVDHFGALDVLVGNHGIWPADDVAIDAMTDAQWTKTVAVNLDSMFALVKHAVAQMKRQQRAGHIVLVSSTAGQRGEPGHADYAATKGAIISMVKGLATELAPFGIHVNCVAPGWVDTDMSADALQDAQRGGEIFAKIPLARVGTPNEIAGPILFLCTAHAGFITGEIFNVNGGAVLVG